jgi:hypothetical protein
MQAKNAGAIKDMDGLPSARIAKVMWPAKETESMVAWERKVQRETREMPDGLRLRSSCREKRMRIVR